MQRKEAIEELCKLSTEVGSFFNEVYAHDCFCGQDKHGLGSSFAFDQQVLDFIRAAVLARMKDVTVKNKEAVKQYNAKTRKLQTR